MTPTIAEARNAAITMCLPHVVLLDELFIRQRRHSREHLALKKLETRSATSGDVRNLVGDSRLLHSGYGVSPAHDAGRVVIPCDCLGDGVGSLGEGGHFEDAH